MTKNGRTKTSRQKFTPVEVPISSRWLGLSSIPREILHDGENKGVDEHQEDLPAVVATSCPHARAHTHNLWVRVVFPVSEVLH